MDAVITGATWTILPALVILAIAMFIAGAVEVTEDGIGKGGVVSFGMALFLAFLVATWISALL